MNPEALLLNAVSAFSRGLSKVYFPFSRKLITAEQFRDIELLCQPGDVLLTRTRGEVSNVFIPGFWSHVALVKDKHSVIEAITSGVQQTDLAEFCFRRDYIQLLQPQFNKATRGLSAVFAESAVGKEYDYRFQGDTEAFYCSELVFWSYAEACRRTDDKFPLKYRRRFGYDTYTPQDVSKDAYVFPVVYSTHD